jgi:hypothetical protein
VKVIERNRAENTFKKDKQLEVDELNDPRVGSQFVFIGMDSESKLILAHKVGKRRSLLK